VSLVNRTYTPRTSRLLSEYLAHTYPTARVVQEMHITRPNPEAIAKAGGKVSPLFGSTILGYADAAVILPAEVQLWEAKDAPSGAAIGQLLQYGRWWPTSYEGSQNSTRVLTLHLLVATDRPEISAAARADGIEVVVYAPAWFATSIEASTQDSFQRRLAALSQPILELYVESQITRDQAAAKLVDLGMSYDSALARLENAKASASAPVT
jgi:hypothetical protein